MSKSSSWNLGFIRHAFRRSRSTVERLEDRILLSAEPLLQFNRLDNAQPLVVENLDYSAQKNPAYPLDMAAISSIASLIDLTKPLAAQDSKFNWVGSTSSQLKLNSQLSALVLDLGAGDTQVSLSDAGNGMLRLSRLGGDALLDLVFTKPTGVLGIRGSGGQDSLVLNTLDLGATSLSVDMEHIELPAASSVTSLGNMLLTAKNSFTGDLGLATVGSGQLGLSSSILVAGHMQVSGSVVLAAQVSVALQQDVALTGFYTVNGATRSSVRVTDGAQITAQSLSLSATTDARWAVSANDGLVGGHLALNLNQSTEAVVEGGVSIAVAPDGLGAGLVVEATDWTDAAVTLNMADGNINKLAQGTEAGQALQGFELGWTQIDLVRNTVASLGSMAAGQPQVRIAGQSGKDAGLVQVAAASFDGKGDANGENKGIQGSVTSSLVGLHISNVQQNVQAFVVNSSLDVGALNVYALNDSSYTASGKIAMNRSTGATQAWLDSVTLTSAGALSVIAQDLSSYQATSAGFSADIPKLDSIKLGIASTSNTVERRVLASVLNSSVSASEVALLADSRETLTVTLESMAVSGATQGSGASGTSGFQMSFGGTFAWNQLTGSSQAFVDNSALQARDGDLAVQARNASALSAKSRAGTAVSGSSGAAAGASLAFNAVGWDMGNIVASGINSLLGTDLGATELPLLTQAFVRGSDVSTSGDASVTAKDAITVDAQIVNAADVLAGDAASGLSVGAALILASNRVRAETRAYIDGKKRLVSAAPSTFTSAGGITVSATDDSGITADAAMSANVSSGGGAVAAGGVIVRNDVRSHVSSEASTLVLQAAGDTSILATASATIDAILSGNVKSEAPSSEPGSPGGTSMAANGLIASNLILVEASAALRDSVAQVGANLGVDAQNSATINAENTASTESSGTAVGVVLAFNTVGWKAQNLLFAAVDTLLGGDPIGGAQPALASAEISNTALDVGADLQLTAVSVPQINATIENSVSSSGGAAVGLVLASNLVNSRSNVLLTPSSTTGAPELALGTVFTVGANVLAKASDTSGIVARIGASAGSEGAAALGAQLVRNDVRSAVEVLVDRARLDAAGDVTLLARGSASIEALLTDQALPAGAAPETAAPAAAAAPAPAGEASMAFKGLIATNLVLSDVRMTILNSDIHAGGDLSAVARNAAKIDATNNAKADAAGTAVGVTLAFNTIGWTAQNVLFNAIDALLGGSIGEEQPAQILATVSGSNLSAQGNLSIDAQAKEHISATITNEAASSGASVAAGMVLASNLLSARVRASVAPALNAPDRVILSAGGSLQVTAKDDAAILSDVSLIASSSGAAAVGGQVVRNDVRSQVLAEVDRVTGQASENFLVLALESATIEATLAGQAKSLAAPAGSTTASASPLALNGLIATNLVLSEASATASHSDLSVDGNLSVQADNLSTISANNSASLESDGTALGVTLAFNTIGWKPQNLFANAIDALLGTDALGSAQPALVSALVLDTHFTVGGDVAVTAGGLDESAGAPVGAHISATISNESTANAANASASFVLASNKVSSTSQAWVGPLLPKDSAIASAAHMQLVVGGQFNVKATDAGTIEADVSLSASSGGGAAVGGMVVMNDLRGDVLAGMDRVDLIAVGDVSIVASETASLGSTLAGSTTSPASESGGAAATPMSFNALIANNVVLGSSRAVLSLSHVQADGGLTVQADNVSDITATNTATMRSGGTAVGATLAFNTMGWASQNVLHKAVDALIGTQIGDEDPLVVLAKTDAVELALGGDLQVLSNMHATLTAHTSNEASSDSAGAAASLVLASNMVSTNARAFIDQTHQTAPLTVAGAVTVRSDDTPSIVGDTVVSATSSGAAAAAASDGAYLQVDHHSQDGAVQLAFSDQVMVDAGYTGGGTPGRIYRYLGAGGTLDLSVANYTRSGLWYELLPPTGFVGDVLGFLGSAMPSIQKEVVLTTLPMGGVNSPVGVKVAGGWGGMSVGDFLNGVNGDQAAGITSTDQGISLNSGSLLGHAGPDLSLELLFPNPVLPSYDFKQVLGTVDHGGSSYDWGVHALVGWPDAKLFDLINLPALLQGRFEPLLPVFNASVFFGDMEIDSLHFLPAHFIIEPPAVRVTVLGKPVELRYGSQMVVDTPDALKAFIDPSLAPRVIKIPTIDLDQLMKVKGADTRAATYWANAMVIDVSNPQLPYIEKQFTVSTTLLAGQSWDVGLKVGAGWQNTTLLDMLTGEAKPGGISALDLGVKIQAPAIDIAGYVLQGPELNLQLTLPNPALPYYDYRYALGQLAVPATTGSPAKAVDWGLELAVGWQDTLLLDLVDMAAWQKGDFSVQLPKLKLQMYIDLPQGIAPGAVAPFLPQFFDVALPSFKATIMGHELSIGFGQTLRYTTPDSYASYIDKTLPAGQVTLPGLDLDIALSALRNGTSATLEDMKFVPTGKELAIDLTHPSSVNEAFRTLIQVIPDSYKISDPHLSGKVFGVQLDATIPLAQLAPHLVEFSLSEILPASVYQLMEPFIKKSTSPADVVAITLPEMTFPPIGSSVPFVNQFLDLLKVMPTEVRLFNPTVSASLLGLNIDQRLPLSDAIQAVASQLGLKIFTFHTDAADPSKSYLQFSLLDMIDKLPQTVQDILGYFIDKGIDTSGRPPLELHVPELVFGDLTPARLLPYLPYVKLGTAVLAKLGFALPFINLDPTTPAQTAKTTPAASSTPAVTTPAASTAAPSVVAGTWVDANQTLASALGQSELQTLKLQLQLAPTAQAASFTLALGQTQVTDDIAVLALGASSNALERITFLNPQANVNKKYQLVLGGQRSAELTFSNDPLRDAAVLQKAIEGLLKVPAGKGAVSVTFNQNSKNVRTFDIAFGAALGGKDIGQITAERVQPIGQSLAANTLQFHTSTVRQGHGAYTAADQVRLIQAAIDKKWGAGLVTVGVDKSGQYLLSMKGKYDNLNLGQIKASTLSKGLAVSTATQRQGQLASGSAYSVDLAAPADTKNFNLQVDLNGVTYSAENLAIADTPAQLRSALLAALSATGERLDASGLAITVTAGSKAGQWTVAFGVTADALSVTGLRTQLPAAVAAGPGAALPEVPTASAKGAMAVGGLVVRNDVRAFSEAFIRYANLTAGSVSVSVSEAASIEASLQATASASGGSGKGLAVGGAIATNLILNQSAAYISDSTVHSTDGGVSVDASNTASINAVNNSAISSDGTAVGVTLAFNTIGWQAQNLLFAAIDALVGSDIGEQQPAAVKAYLYNTDVQSVGALSVHANNAAEILSEIKNEVASALAAAPADSTTPTSAAAAKGGSSKSISAGFVLASNMVSSAASATISHDDTLAMRTLTAGAGGLSVVARDDARIVSRVDLSVIAGEEGELAKAMRSFINLFGVTYSDYSGTQKVLFSDRVRVGGPDYTTFDRPASVTAGDRVELRSSLGGGQAGDLYAYIGTEDLAAPRLDKTDFSDKTLWRKISGKANTTYVFKGLANGFDLGLEDFTDTGRWLAIDLASLVDIAAAAAEAAGALTNSSSAKSTGGDSGFGGLVVRNDVRSDVSARVEGFNIDATGNVTISATESAIILAQDKSAVQAQGVGVNVVVANNTILGSTSALLKNSRLVTASDADGQGDLSVTADNMAFVLAEVNSSVKASTSVGVVLAFNTIGYTPQNLLYNIVDGVLGTSLAGQDKLSTFARIDNTPLELAGALNLSAMSDGQIQALIVNAALALSVSTSGKSTAVTVAPIIAMNKIASQVEASVDRTTKLLAGGDITVQAKGNTRIESQVAASAIGIAANTSGSGIAVSVGLSLTRNDVQSDVTAFVRGLSLATPAEVTSASGDILLLTERGSAIVANGRATAVAVGVSTVGAATAVAAAGTLALNRITGTAQAYAQWATLSTFAIGAAGNVAIKALDDALIDANLRSVAASVSVGMGASAAAAAVGLSVARNLIGQAPVAVSYDYKASAYDKDNKLTDLVKGKRVLLDSALMGNDIYEYIGDPISKINGIDLVNQNYSDESQWHLVSYSANAAITRAQLVDSQVRATGALNLEVLSSAEIKATVLAATAAIGAAGGGSAFSLSAAGAYAENRIRSTLQSGVVGNAAAPLTIEAGQITVRAESLATIDAITGAAALSASLSGAGTAASVAIGLSLAFNSIDSDVLADVVGANLLARSGSIALHAISSGVDRKELDYPAMQTAGLSADALSALANAGKAASCSSTAGQEWDYLTSDAMVELRKTVTGSVLGTTSSRNPKVRVEVLDSAGKVTGDYRIYELTNDALLYSKVDLSKANFAGSTDWREVVTAMQTVKAGYTVKVADGHSAGGEVGRVYVYGGVTEDYSTEDGERIEGKTWHDVKNGDVILVGSNHMVTSTFGPPQESGLAGKLYKYLGTSQRLDISTEDFTNAGNWQALAVQEKIALWKENFSDTSRWRLAPDFANPATQTALVGALQAAGLQLPAVDLIHSSSLYRSNEGLAWDFSSEAGKVLLLNGNVVGIATGKDAGTLYRFKGTSDVAGLVSTDPAKSSSLSDLQVDLSKENYSDTKRWEKVKASPHWLVKGDTVRVLPSHAGGGEPNSVYRYIGTSNQLLMGDENYSDNSRWALQAPEITVSVMQAGLRWKLVDASGKSYTLTFTAPPAGSSAATTAVISRNSINAVSVAASAAIGLSAAGVGLALSGAGAVAVNTISGATDALLRASSAWAAGDVLLSASSDKTISATIAALSLAVGAGATTGVGASIGIAVARNLIGQEGFGMLGDAAIATVQALVIDSHVHAGGLLDLRADTRQTIDALVVSGSAAVAGGVTTGVGISGSGVWAENQIGTRVHAGVTTLSALGARPSVIEASEVLVMATDHSSIRSFAGAASLAIAFGGDSGVAVSVGVSLARNIINGSVLASIDGAQLVSHSRVTVQALSDADIQVFGLAASIAFALGGGSTGVGVSGAGASALNVILGDTLARVHDSDITAGGDVTVDANASNRIAASIISASIGVGVAGAGVGVGASVGVSLARNYVGYDPTGFSGAVDFVSGKDKPSRISKGQMMRLSAASGARANEVYQYIGSDDLLRVNDKDGNPIDLILSQDFADTKKWTQLSQPRANRIEAFVTDSSVAKWASAPDTVLNFHVTALTQQSIASTVFAGSVAIAGGGTAAVAISGAGASAVNRVGSTTRAYVANTSGRGIKVDGDIVLDALDISSISSSVMAVSASASIGSFGGSLSLSVSLSDNSITSTTEAFSDLALLMSTNGSVRISAQDQSNIDASSVAVSVDFSASIGVSFAGGGANAFNTIETTTRAWSGRSTDTPVTQSITGLSEIYAAQDITVSAVSASTANARVRAAAASFGMIAAAAAGTVTRNTLSPVVEAFIKATDVQTPGTVLIAARADQTAYAQSDALAISGGISMSVGVSAVTTLDASKIYAAIDDNARVLAGVLRVSANAYDKISQKSSASSGGLIAGAGAVSDLQILGSTIARVGSKAELLVGLLDLLANRDQDFDAQALNIAVGLYAGSGATVTNLVAGTADVKIGSGAQVHAESILISANNQAVKNKYSSKENSLESFSASAASISAIVNTTYLGSGNAKFGATVDIAADAALTVSTAATNAGVFRIETLSTINLVDKVRVDGVSGLGITVAVAIQEAHSVSNITVGSGASLRNLSGDLVLATRTNADMMAGANTFSLSAYGLANATAQVSLSANNDITLTDAALVGRDVKLMAGQSRDRVPNIILGKARADMAMVSLMGITAPIRSVTLDEHNQIALQGSTQVRAIGNVDLLAEKAWAAPRSTAPCSTSAPVPCSPA